MKVFRVLVLCGVLACLSAFAAIDHSDAGGHAIHMAALAREDGVAQIERTGATNLDLLVTTLRERLSTNAISDRLHVQLAWVYEMRACQAMKGASSGDIADRKTTAGEWRQQGISELKDAVRLNSRNAFAWLLLGMMQSEVGELDVALVNCQRATRLRGTAFDYWITASLLNAAEQYADALEAAERALNRDPECASAWIEAGIARAKLGKMDVALHAADKAVRLQPQNGFILQQAARVYRLAEKLPESNALAQQANAAAPELAENYCILARNACDQGHYETALDYAQAVLRLEPLHAEAFYTIGRAHDGRGEFEDALHACQSANKLSPRRADFQSGFGIAFEKLGRFGEAEDAYRRAISLAPDKPEWVEMLSGFFQRRGRDNEAIVILEQAIHAGITNKGVVQNMGNSLSRVRRYRDALPYLEQIAQNTPTNCLALACLAQCYGSLNSNKQAVTAWQQACGLCPTNWEYRGLLADCLAKTGDLLAAETACREALDLAPTNNTLHDVITFQLYSALMQQGRKAEALAGFNRLLDSSPTNHTVRIFVATSLQRNDEVHAAETVLQRGIEIAPDNADLWARLAEVKLRTNPADVVRCAQHSLMLSPTNFSAHCALGYWNYACQHDRDAAKTNLEAAIRDDPGRKEPFIWLGEMFGKAGDADTAERYFLKALAIDPSDANILTSLGYARYLKHDYAGAVVFHARAIEANSNFGLAHFNLALACLETGEYQRGIAHWHKAREAGYKGNEKLLQILEERKRAAGP